MDGIEEVVGFETIVEMLPLGEQRRAWRSIVVKINVDTALQQGKLCYLKLG